MSTMTGKKFFEEVSEQRVVLSELTELRTDLQKLLCYGPTLTSDGYAAVEHELSYTELRIKELQQHLDELASIEIQFPSEGNQPEPEPEPETGNKAEDEPKTLADYGVIKLGVVSCPMCKQLTSSIAIVADDEEPHELRTKVVYVCNNPDCNHTWDVPIEVEPTLEKPQNQP